MYTYMYAGDVIWYIGYVNHAEVSYSSLRHPPSTKAPQPQHHVAEFSAKQVKRDKKNHYRLHKKLA